MGLVEYVQFKMWPWKTHTNAFMFCAVLAIMLSMSWKLTLVALAVFPLHVATHFLFEGRVRRASKEFRQKQAEISGYAAEKLAGAKVVKSFAAENRESLAFAQETREALGLNLHMGVLSMQWNSAATLCQFVGKIIVLVFGGGQVIPWLRHGRTGLPGIAGGIIHFNRS